MYKYISSVHAKNTLYTMTGSYLLTGENYFQVFDKSNNLKKVVVHLKGERPAKKKN